MAADRKPRAVHWERNNNFPLREIPLNFSRGRELACIKSHVGFLNFAVTFRNCCMSMASLKRKVLSLEARMDVLKRLDSGQSCRSVAMLCGCGKSQIARVRQERAEIEREWASGGRCDLKYLKRRKKTMYEDLNGLVWDWFCTARSKELPISGRMLQVCFI